MEWPTAFPPAVKPHVNEGLYVYVAVKHNVGGKVEVKVKVL